MKDYYLNIVLDDTDNLVTTYGSLEELKTFWKRDMDAFLKRNGIKRILSDSSTWYPYFTHENDEGEIQELSFSEIRESAA